MPGTDLLNDRLITIDTGGGPERVSLPDVLAHLASARQASFPRLRAHQRHGWHVFLTSLGRIALDHASRDDLPEAAADWRALLGALTRDHPTAWQLIVEDHDRPAFLQPAVPDGDVTGFKATATPDMIDLHQTGRDHAVKAFHDNAAAPEDWIYALVSAQTLAPHSHKDNFRCVRTAGGYAGRVVITTGERDDPAALFRRDLRALNGLRAPERFHRGGPGLIWLTPWGGGDDEALSLNGLHPQFIEVARRIRLTGRRGGVTALTKGSRTPRFAAARASAGVNGLIGDPWTPIDRAGSRVLHPPKDGFDSSLTLGLLLDARRYTPAPLQVPRPEELDSPRLLVIARTLPADRGWLGSAERIIEIPRTARHTLGEIQRAPESGELIRAALAEVDRLRHEALLPAVARLADPLHREIDWDRLRNDPEHQRRVMIARRTYSRTIEPAFLGALHLLNQEPRHMGPGHSQLRIAAVEAARSSLDAAMRNLRLSGHQGQRARMIASNSLESGLERLLRPMMRKAA